MKIPIIIFTIAVGFMLADLITLEDLRWKKRIILIFPDSMEYKMDLSDSLKLEMELRDMVYFVLADSLYSNTEYAFDQEYIQELRTRYLLGSKSTCWVLLGKDGGLKLREEDELNLEHAFQTVDSQPLRNEVVNW